MSAPGATPIILYHTTTASAQPSTSNLNVGELAINVTDKKVYSKDGGGALITVVGTLGNQDANSVAITGGTIAGITDLAVADGGTGASDATNARTNLSAAKSGANSDITSLAGLTTPLSVAQGGTGATTLTGLAKGSGTSAFTAATAGTDYAGITNAQTFTGSQRGAVTTDNDLSFDLSAGNNFYCTLSAGGTLTFTNIVAGQSGYIYLVNGSAYAVSKAASVKAGATLLSTISATGNYIISYFAPDASTVVITSSQAVS
ncbi:MAG: putative tail fiber [Caudovirales sp. ctOwN3]|nr:MAG: putative tail fiber [Caudovirales sp. ctOwN3]